MPAEMGKRIRDANMGRLPRTIDVTDFLVVAEVVAEVSVAVIAVVVVHVLLFFLCLWVAAP